MKYEKLRVVFDLDDVGREFYPKVISTYSRVFPDFKCPKSIEEITLYKMEEFFDERADIYDFISKDRVEEIYQEAPVEPEFKETLNFIRELGHTVIIATNNSGKRAIATNIWLGINNIEFDELHYGADKWRARGNLYIDDATHNLENIKKNQSDSICYAYDKPWNQDYHGKRVYNMQQIRNIIEGELF